MIGSMGIIFTMSDLKVFGERPEVLVALLKRVEEEGDRHITITFDELAKECGYANRSGVWKYINKLEARGIVTKLHRGVLRINLPLVV